MEGEEEEETWLVVLEEGGYGGELCVMVLITTCSCFAEGLCLVEINQEEKSSSEDELWSQNNPRVLLLRCSWYIVDVCCYPEVGCE